MLLQKLLDVCLLAGQPRQSCFNIKQHGFEKARRLAVQARQTLMGMSTTKKPNFPPTEAERMATSSVSAPPAAREAAAMATRLPGKCLICHRCCGPQGPAWGFVRDAHAHERPYVEYPMVTNFVL